MPVSLSKLKSFIDGGNFIVSVPLEKYENSLVGILGYLTNKKRLKGVLLTANKPYMTLKILLEKNKINIENLLIIDCISSTKEERRGNCFYLKRPFNPTSVAITLEAIISDSKVKFLIFDSLTTILTYDSVSITRFFQFMLSEMAKENKLAIILAVDIKTTDKDVSIIAQSCDKIIEV